MQCRGIMASVRALLRPVARMVRMRCHHTVLARSGILTLQLAVTTNGPTTAWSTTRLSSSIAATQPSLAATQPSPAHPTLECSTDGKKLKVSWPDGEHSSYHSLWLRHNCTCPMCWDAPTDQRKVRPSDLAGGPTIHNTEICGSPDGSSKLNIWWSYSNGSQHQGEIDLEWLRENSYSPTSLRERQQCSMPPVTTSLPQMSYSAVLKGEEGVWKWLRHLNENGVCLLTDVPTELGHIKKVVESAGLFPVANLYGMIFDVIAVEKPTNLGHSSQTLPFHMDLSYYESPPGLELLHCIRNDACVEGGESILLDAFAVVEEMRKKHPQHFATLTRVPTTFQRADRSKKGVYVYKRPHISVDSSSNVTGIFWSPVLEGPLSIPEENVERYYEAYTCLAAMFDESNLKAPGFHHFQYFNGKPGQGPGNKANLHHRLKPGEAMTFNNRRFIHSRTAFKLNGGMRHLQIIYVNIDDFKSRVHALASQFSPTYSVKTVFNQDIV